MEAHVTNGMAGVSSIQFQGTHISEDLLWTTNTSSWVKKAQQHLFNLKALKKKLLFADILLNFYCWAELPGNRPQATAAGGENCPGHHKDFQ